MKTRMKKILSLGLTLSMVMSLAACQKEAGQNVSNQNSESSVESTVTAETPSEEVDVYEATAYPESVTVFTSRTPSKIKDGEEDYNASASFRMMEEMTGTHIEWSLNSDFDQKFQLMLASGEYPDVICSWWKNLGAEQAVEDGVILDLTEYAEYMPNFIKFTKENPEIAKDYLTADGRILYMPFIRLDKELCVFQGPCIRMDWLEKLGLDAPTDPDSLYDVLVAFKTQDPNGNGLADEIPMSGSTGAKDKIIFPMFDTSDGFYLENGKVMYGPMTENYDKALEYAAKLYKEGLLDEEYVTLLRNDLVGKITNNLVGFAFEYQTSAISRTMAEIDPNFNFIGIPWLENSKGAKVSNVAGDIQQVVPTWLAAVSTQCENPESVIKWLDSFYSEEAIEIMNFGEEGVTYNLVDGEYVYTDYITNNSNPDYNQDKMMEWEIGSISGTFPQLQLWDAFKQKLTEEGMSSIETWATADTSMLLPSLTFTAEENEKISNIMAQVNTLVAENKDQIVMGQKSVDVMDEVRAQMTKVGIEEVISIYQAAYDRRDSIVFAE